MSSLKGLAEDSSDPLQVVLQVSVKFCFPQFHPTTPLRVLSMAPLYNSVIYPVKPFFSALLMLSRFQHVTKRDQQDTSVVALLAYIGLHVQPSGIIEFSWLLKYPINSWQLLICAVLDTDTERTFMLLRMASEIS